jgi:site-specific DNA-methyltransferase (adenine-specific)
VTAVVLRGDARRLPLPDASVDLIVTSPPYFGLRSYTDDGAHYDGQIGSEATPAEWLDALLTCTRDWVRVLKPSGSIFVNLGDKYSTGNSGESGMAKLGERWAGGGHSDAKAKRKSAAVPGLPPKTLLGLPWRYALACMDQLGLILRRDIIWSKPNGLPESVTDRCRSSHEYLFHLVRQPRYYAAVDEIREPHLFPNQTRTSDKMARGWSHVSDQKQTGLAGPLNPLGKLPGSVWSIPSQPLTVPAGLGVDHFAAFPMELPRRCVLGWSPPGVCTACGEGRRPVAKQIDEAYAAERARMLAHRQRTGRESSLDEDFGRVSGRTNVGGFTNISNGVVRPAYAITGYVCACPQPGAPVRPALVVDPFCGTGTTMLTASMLGRIGIGVDMSADYCRLARWRCSDPGERAKALQVPKPPPVPEGQASLFDDEAV